jgi:hypothetical protein
MEDVGILFVHLAIGYVLWPFGIFKVNWYSFSPLWYVTPRKIWQPCSETEIDLRTGERIIGI